MKIIKELSEDEAKQMMPEGLRDVLFGQSEEEVIYCMTCDGLRFKNHECVSCIPSERKSSKGENI